MITKMKTKIISKMLITKNCFLHTIFRLYNFMIFVIIGLCYHFVMVFKYCLSSNFLCYPCYVITFCYHFLYYHLLTIISSFIFLVVICIIFFYSISPINLSWKNGTLQQIFKFVAESALSNVSVVAMSETPLVRKSEKYLRHHWFSVFLEYLGESKK